MMARFSSGGAHARRPEFFDLPMIGLVLVTHGRLAVEFRAALEHVVGEQKQIETVTIGPDDDVEQRRRDIIEAVKRADHGDGVVILTDMFGGTPSNLSISVMNRPNVEVVAGHQPADAGEAREGAGRVPARQVGRRRAGSRQEIHHRCEPRACREMSASMTAMHGAVTRVLKIVNEKGLHARASAKFVAAGREVQGRAAIKVAPRRGSVGRRLDHGADDARGRDRQLDHRLGNRRAGEAGRRGARRAGVGRSSARTNSSQVRISRGSTSVICGNRITSRRPTTQEHDVRHHRTRSRLSMVMPAMPHVMNRPTPIGGRNSPIPVAATTTIEKCTRSMLSCFTTGRNVGSRMITAGNPSSIAPSRMKSSAVRIRNGSGRPRSPSLRRAPAPGTCATASIQATTAATASRKQTLAVITALSIRMRGRSDHLISL